MSDTPFPGTPVPGTPVPGAPPARDHGGAWFADERGVERRLRVSWHADRQLFVLSLWQGDACTATFRLPLGQVPRLVGALLEGLGEAATGAASRRARGARGGGTGPASPRRRRPGGNRTF
jgi:hypothetical protein